MSSKLHYTRKLHPPLTTKAKGELILRIRSTLFVSSTHASSGSAKSKTLYCLEPLTGWAETKRLSCQQKIIDKNNIHTPSHANNNMYVTHLHSSSVLHHYFYSTQKNMNLALQLQKKLNYTLQW